MKESLYQCEECKKLLTLEDITTDVKSGYHVCRMKNYKDTHYCESYVEHYERVK